MSGVAPTLMGAYAEEWTAQSLRAFRKKGWHLVNGMQLRSKSDIDHVVIGPSGVLVVETKWSSEPWPTPLSGHDFMKSRLNETVENVLRNRSDFVMNFKKNLGDIPVQAICVLWTTDPNPEETPWELRGVKIIPGMKLRSWLKSLDSSLITNEQVNAIFSEVERHVLRRDKHDVNQGFVAQPSLRRLVTERALLPMVGALFAFYLSILTTRIIEKWQATMLVTILFLSLGLVLLLAKYFKPRHRQWVRWTLWGWTVASGAVVVLYAVVVIRTEFA
jgi:hypothetical protein